MNADTKSNKLMIAQEAARLEFEAKRKRMEVEFAIKRAEMELERKRLRLELAHVGTSRVVKPA